MKEDYNIKDPKVDDLINRLRFKLPEYDTISNYKRLQERINTPVISLSKNISGSIYHKYFFKFCQFSHFLCCLFCSFGCFSLSLY